MGQETFPERLCLLAQLPFHSLHKLLMKLVAQKEKAMCVCVLHFTWSSLEVICPANIIYQPRAKGIFNKQTSPACLHLLLMHSACGEAPSGPTYLVIYGNYY